MLYSTLTASLLLEHVCFVGSVGSVTLIDCFPIHAAMNVALADNAVMAFIKSTKSDWRSATVQNHDYVLGPHDIWADASKARTCAEIRLEPGDSSGDPLISD